MDTDEKGYHLGVLVLVLVIIGVLLSIGIISAAIAGVLWVIAFVFCVRLDYWLMFITCVVLEIIATIAVLYAGYNNKKEEDF